MIDGWMARFRGPGWGQENTDEARVAWHELKTGVFYRHEQASVNASGRGLLAGIEFVEDTRTGAPFPRTVRFAETFTEQALAAGLVVWPNTGHVDGTRGDLVMLAPPYIVTPSELDEIVTRFAAALDRTLAALAVGAR